MLTTSSLSIVEVRARNAKQHRQIAMSEKSQRSKRNVRDSNPPPIVLTERDKRLLEMVYLCRCLRQDQIHSLFFGGAKSASQHRLMLLYHHGFLNRIFLTTRASIQFSAVAYVLDKPGATVLQAEFGYSITSHSNRATVPCAHPRNQRCPCVHYCCLSNSGLYPSRLEERKRP